MKNLTNKLSSIKKSIEESIKQIFTTIQDSSLAYLQEINKLLKGAKQMESEPIRPICEPTGNWAVKWTRTCGKHMGEVKIVKFKSYESAAQFARGFIDGDLAPYAKPEIVRLPNEPKT